MRTKVCFNQISSGDGLETVSSEQYTFLLFLLHISKVAPKGSQTKDYSGNNLVKTSVEFLGCAAHSAPICELNKIGL